ncbi:MAG TPA: FoF1 ATP synthase subunit gamma [Pseudacidobacterium sp.]|nr:FoF1 ATP synthase subunit gamma [Pseudacidobacterium sp.]
MANVLDLRRRIRSVKNTRQITKAMKMVAAARLRRAQEKALSSRPYAMMMTSVLQSLRRRVDAVDPETGQAHPLLVVRPEKNILLIVVSGEGGFAGAFNANIVKAANIFIAERKDAQIDIEAIGRKGRDVLRRRYPLAQWADAEKQEERRRIAPVELLEDHHHGILHKLTFEQVSGLAHEIISLYAHEKIDAAYVVYNEFKSVIQQRVVVERVLPVLEIGKREVALAQEMTQEERERAGEAAISSGVTLSETEAEADAKQAEEEARRFGTAEVDYIYEQNPGELFNALLPRYVATQLYHAMLESTAAEFAARMTAMDSATNNASELIDSLTLAMNRVRQAAITKELIEIVSGAAAL